MLTREDDIGVHALRRQGWTISAIVRHLAGLPQFVGRLGLGRECFRSSGAWRVGWNPISCRHTICGVSLEGLGLAGWVVGMYLRETRRANRDGSVVLYLQLAHNERHPGRGARSRR